MMVKQWHEDPTEIYELWEAIRSRSIFHKRVSQHDDTLEDPFLKPPSPHSNLEDAEAGQVSDMDDDSASLRGSSGPNMDMSSYDRLSLIDTARLSFEFCFLWFMANYFSIGCLEYTTVGSATILTSTSSIWTLLCGTLVGVERFTVRKLLGVLASLAGIILISSVDIYESPDKDRGTFPHKTPREIAVGDLLAFVSAIVYGVYAVVMKKRIGNEGRVNMPIFFGMVGLLNVLLLWPGFIILHLTGIERFELPPDGRVLSIILVSSHLWPPSKAPYRRDATAVWYSC
jgi:solute carrier family 35, member F5